MRGRTVDGAPQVWLATADLVRLEDRLERAAELADRSGRPVLAAVSAPIPAGVDVSAVVIASRHVSDRAFCMEHPDRDGYAIAGLGATWIVRAHGRGRMAEAQRSIRDLARGALVDDVGGDPQRPSGSGPCWQGGLSFADEGGWAPEWSSLEPLDFVLPEVGFARHGGEARITLAGVVEPGHGADAALARLEERVASLREAPPPLLDPDPARPARVGGGASASHYEAAVARGVERIKGGEVEKIVLAREVRVQLAPGIRDGAVFDALRGAFPSCYAYLVSTPELAFVGASPELLVRRDGMRAQTVALAGTTRRSADPSVDAHLGEQLFSSAKDREEQAIVAHRIERSLRPVSVWVAAAPEPVIVKVQNVQHLATPVRAQLAEATAALDLAARLHPTPAVGGEPSERALSLITELEGIDRGWYAGAVGWTDIAEDGELCVAIRCALLRGRVAHLYAGCGIVGDSDPSAELAETEVKLEALLPLLT